MQSNSLGRIEEGGAEPGALRERVPALHTPACYGKWVRRWSFLLSCSPLSTLKAPPHSSLGSSVSVTPRRAYPLILLTRYWFPCSCHGPLGGAGTSSPGPFSEFVLNIGQSLVCHRQGCPSLHNFIKHLLHTVYAVFTNTFPYTGHE